MKTKVTILFVLFVLMVNPTQAQNKKEIEADLAKCTVIKDSLQTALTSLSASYDTIQKDYQVYDTMYHVIKEKVFMYDFDPAAISELIDSLRTGREEAFSEITTVLNDSISILAEENIQLKETIEDLKGGVDEGDEAVDDLKKLKELLDAEVITQEEFDERKAVLLEKL